MSEKKHTYSKWRPGSTLQIVYKHYKIAKL